MISPASPLAPRASRYRIYGLSIDSDIALAGLPVAAADLPADIEIVRATVERPPLAGREEMRFSTDAVGPLLVWAAVGAFRIVADHRIEVDPIAGAPDSLVALPLLGAVLATLLQRRGLYVLHASAVSVCGRAVALLGDKGAGKSTTAAALVRAGHQLIADDVVALDFSVHGRPVVLPAFGQLKLWHDARAQLGEFGLRDRGRLVQGIDKSTFEIGAVAAEPVPLARLLVLRRGTVAGFTALSGPEGVSALLRFSYMGRFAEAGFGPTLGAHFQRSAALVKAGFAAWLDVPHGLERIDEVTRAIANDAAIPAGA